MMLSRMKIQREISAVAGHDVHKNQSAENFFDDGFAMSGNCDKSLRYFRNYPIKPYIPRVWCY